MHRSVVMVLVGLASCAPSADSDDFDGAVVQREVEAATDAAFAAVVDLSIDRFLAVASQEPVADDGRLTPVEEIRTTYAQLYAGLRSMAFDRERTLVYVLAPDAAVVVTEGPFTTVTTDGTATEGRGAWTFVWQQQQGSWRLLHFHQSIVNPQV